jgi:hypothetical protein
MGAITFFTPGISDVMWRVCAAAFYMAYAFKVSLIHSTHLQDNNNPWPLVWLGGAGDCTGTRYDSVCFVSLVPRANSWPHPIFNMRAYSEHAMFDQRKHTHTHTHTHTVRMAGDDGTASHKGALDAVAAGPLCSQRGVVGSHQDFPLCRVYQRPHTSRGLPHPAVLCGSW